MLAAGVRVEQTAQLKPAEHKGETVGTLTSNNCVAAPGLVAEMQIIDMAEDK